MTRKSWRKVVVIFALLGSLAVSFGSGASAGHGGTKPGWGRGDKNNRHTGPPGTVIPKPGPGCVKPIFWR